MNAAQQWEYLEMNFECVDLRWIPLRSRYRLVMGRFDPNKYVATQPFIGIDDYWTIEASEESIVISSAFHEVKSALMYRCGIPRVV